MLRRLEETYSKMGLSLPEASVAPKKNRPLGRLIQAAQLMASQSTNPRWQTGGFTPDVQELFPQLFQKSRLLDLFDVAIFIKRLSRCVCHRDAVDDTELAH